MKLRSLEYNILKEIADKNYRNLCHDFFKTSETEFEESLDNLKAYGFIRGRIFESNGVMMKPFNFFFLSEKGEGFLNSAAV